MAEVPVKPQQASTGINWKTILITSVIGGLVIVIGALGFYIMQNQSKNTTSTQVTTTKTSTESAEEATSSADNKDDNDQETVELKGTFNRIYGDPLDENKPPVYRYSITDSKGKTTELSITEDTKYVGGIGIFHFNQRVVKITGKLVAGTETVEVLTLELE